MSYRAIISDWNGTLTSSSEEESNKKIGYTMLKDTLRGIKHGDVRKLSQLGRLVVAKYMTERKLAAYKRGECHLWDVYAPFNFAIRGQPVGYINGIVDEFARETEVKVDTKVLRPIISAHQNGKTTGILSVAYDHVIRKTLQETDSNDVFDFIVANQLQESRGRAIGFTLGIYGQKPKALKMIMERKGLREDDIFYIGDTEDDAPIADMLPPGNFIVPFLATDDFRQKMASKHKAFVPTDAIDFEKYLKSR